MRRWLETLEGFYAIRLLRPWHASIAKRQVKAPKVYLRDSGMLHALLGINGPGVGQPGSWVVGGSIPPGLNFSGLTAPATINLANLVLTGTPTTSGNFTVTLQGWEDKNRKGNGSPIYNYVINVATGVIATPPAFTGHPAAQTLPAGGTATFSATASGTPT